MTTLIGDDRPETLVGGDEPDVIKGGGGHDVLVGLSGDDVLSGQSGNDTLEGGAGGDNLIGGDGLDFADYRHSASVLVNLGNNAAAGSEAFGDAFSSVEGVLGSNQQDWIVGSADFNVLYGNGGDDLLDGTGGGDLIYGGLGNDYIQGGDGNDDMLGEAGADDIDGGNGFDIAGYNWSPQGVTVNLATNVNTGGDAQGDLLHNIEMVQGSAFDDVLTGDNLANQLEGGEGGFDRINGAGGNDRLSGSGILVGGGGNDSVFGGYFFGSNLNGNTGNDYLIGDRFNDTISGSAGNDTIAGDNGADRLSGGEGADTFWYIFGAIDSGPGANQDQILDFSQSEGDRVDVTMIFDDYDTEGIDEALRFIGKAAFDGGVGELRFVTNANQNASFVQADLDGDKAVDLQIRFTGVINFTAHDFIL